MFFQKSAIFHFPSFDVLQLALISGAVPPAVSQAPAAAAFSDQGRVWVQPSTALTPSARTELRRLGVQVRKPGSVPLDQQVLCWPHLLPVRREPGPLNLAEKTPVLFELAEDQLAELVLEILRLGNDRQTFRRLTDDQQARVLLRVIGPPYYSLLRALDRAGQEALPRAYLERSPRVWVEIGHTHPLVDQIQPPPGQLLLMRPPRQWVTLPEAKFQDIYEILEFDLPDAPVSWHDAGLPQRLKVPLRLGQGGSGEAPELWVLRDHAIDQLDGLVQHANDHLLARLAFAVAVRDGQPTVVLRVRPSRQAPPVLVLEGVGFRPYLKLPNLFLPCNTRLHPPLRRDAVNKLLATDPNQVTWLYPHGDGHFTPERLPDAAFRPLHDWVDYILDHEHQALTAWVQATHFDFESFICRDDEDKAKKGPDRKTPRKETKDQDIELGEGKAGPNPAIKAIKKGKRPPGDDPAEEPRQPVKLDQTLVKLRELENRFQVLTSPLDAEERRDLWREMAQANTVLKRGDDAMLCWANALWEVADPPRSWLESWLRAERSDATGPNLTAADLERLLNKPEPLVADLRTLAAYLVWAASSGRPAPALIEGLARVQQLLEKHERMLPVRAAWLAWVALVHLSQGDVLALARARDRLLERLYQHGLSPEVDLPSFLRFAELRSRERFRAVRDQILRLRQWAHEWIATATLQTPGTCTEDYADLMFAYCLARLGETTECHKLLGPALKSLQDRDVIHTWLRGAFAYRVQQALAGKANAGQLPAELLTKLDDLGRDPNLKIERLKIDRLREFSRILEPHEKIESYRRWHGRFADELSQELALLVDIHDPSQLVSQFTDLFRMRRKWTGVRFPQVQILRTALELAHRLGEAFARDVLNRVTLTLDHYADLPLEQQGRLLENGLFLAAHFDQGAYVQTFVARFHQLLDTQAGSDAVQALEPLMGQCFRGLRKLGMRDEISRLLGQMAEVVLEGREGRNAHVATFKVKTAGQTAVAWADTCQLLLHVAAGWFYFGLDSRARHILDEVRELLLEGDLEPWKQTPLACAYAQTLGQAPVELALQRLSELLRKVQRVSDCYTTNSHYSLSRLRLVEAVVLALVSDDFTVDKAGRRWLDEDEYLVRRRIHRDVRTAMSQAGL
jgi:hypothetical protein